MKNESGVSEDITMLDALQRLWHHKAKRKSIRFEVTFDDVSRKVIFGKVWSRMDNDWNYMSRTVITRPSTFTRRSRWSQPS